jgi:hypothetical protein
MNDDYDEDNEYDPYNPYNPYDYDDEVPVNVPSLTVNVEEKARYFLTTIQETIRTNIVPPLMENVFTEWKLRLHRLFTQVKTGFAPSYPPKTIHEKCTVLLTIKAYRLQMVVLADLMILIVDTMAESGVEVFGNVKGGTRILQEMFRKYSWNGRVQVFPCFNIFFLSRIFPSPKRRDSDSRSAPRCGPACTFRTREEVA